MKGSIFNGMWKVILIVLILAFLKPILNLLNKYYAQAPALVILAIAGMIILVYLAAFFKEIFLRRKSK